ncbi:MAG: homoserine dehydrogenase [Terriglobales bacterium]
MKVIHVGIAGYGTVGRGTAEAIINNAEEVVRRTGARLEVSAVCRRSQIPAASVPPGTKVFSDWRALVNDPNVDVVVETIGGTDVAYDVIRTALECGKPVVTANKKLIAERGAELFALATARQLPLGIEATVAGAVPIVRVLTEGIGGDRVLALRGILNGTANYILSRMQNDGLSFEEALQLAQQAGYAEADPTLDIDGLDARDKLCILTHLAFGCRVACDQIPAQGIRRVSADDFHYARRLHSTIRLLATAANGGDGLHVGVRPWLVSRDSMLAAVEGAHNAVLVDAERSGTHMLYGKGAGGGPTGIAVLSDLLQIARQLASGNGATPHSPVAANGRSCQLLREIAVSPWYLRLTVRDQSGIVARVATALASHDVNIDVVLQEPHLKKDPLSFVMMTEPATEPAISAAVAEIDRMTFLHVPVLALPVLPAEARVGSGAGPSK